MLVDPDQYLLDMIGLVGTGGFAREVARLINAGVPICFVTPKDPPACFTPKEGLDTRYRFLSEQAFLEITDDAGFVNPIGSPVIRRETTQKFVEAEKQPVSLVFSNAQLSNLCTYNQFKEGLIMCEGVIVTVDVDIGRYVHLNIGSMIGHDCVIGDFVTINPGVFVAGNVRIEDEVLIGAGATIRDGTRANPIVIGKGATVGAGAVVVKNVPAGETWVGNPARKLERRKEDGQQ